MICGAKSHSALEQVSGSWQLDSSSTVITADSTSCKTGKKKTTSNNLSFWIFEESFSAWHLLLKICFCIQIHKNKHSNRDLQVEKSETLWLQRFQRKCQFWNNRIRLKRLIRFTVTHLLEYINSKKTNY